MILWLGGFLYFLAGAFMGMAVFHFVQAERLHRRNVKKWGKEFKP